MNKRDDLAQRAGYPTWSAYSRALIARAQAAPALSAEQRAEMRQKAMERANDPQYSDAVRAEFRRIAQGMEES